MADNQRTQKDNTPAPGLGRDQTIGKSGERENISEQENTDQNPQEGKEWNNYQTRELAGKKDDQEKS